MATGHVTNFGNDANDGLSWGTAKGTYQGIADAGLKLDFKSKGFFNETPGSSVYVPDGMNETILDGSNLASMGVAIYLKRLIVQNGNASRLMSSANLLEATIKRCTNVGTSNCRNIISCIFHNNSYYSSFGTYDMIGNTFHSYTLTEINLSNTNISRVIKNNIFSNHQIKFNTYTITASLFINCSLMFVNGGQGNDETTYEYPIGATDADKLQNLRNRMAIVYGGVASDYLVGCKYYSGSYNDIFQDADNGNFYLKEGCIAANMAYDGSYIGAKPVGANLDLSQFTLTNIDANGRVINQELDSTIVSNIIDLLKVRQILEWKNMGSIAARNGQQINTVENLSTPINPGSNVLTDAKVYMCVDDVITLDDAAATSYYPWETFTTHDEGGGAGLGFSTSGSGKVQEVYIDKYDQKIKIKSSKSDDTLATASELQYYLHQQPKCNVDANGEPTRGNADDLFNEAAAVDLFSRYMQFELTIQANQLPAR
jgi:hypothetical protein